MNCVSSSISWFLDEIQFIICLQGVDNSGLRLILLRKAH